MTLPQVPRFLPPRIQHACAGHAAHAHASLPDGTARHPGPGRRSTHRVLSDPPRSAPCAGIITGRSAGACGRLVASPGARRGSVRRKRTDNHPGRAHASWQGDAPSVVVRGSEQWRKPFLCHRLLDAALCTTGEMETKDVLPSIGIVMFADMKNTIKRKSSTRVGRRIYTVPKAVYTLGLCLIFIFGNVKAVFGIFFQIL